MRYLNSRFAITALFLAVLLTAAAVETEVKVANPKAGIELGGTLSTPDNGQPRGVIVMATGSGAQNRDEEVFGFRPFKVLSDALTQAGFAVLRTDDRGVDASGGDLSKSSLEDLAEDIECQINFLNSRFPGIPKGVLGHSQGGSLAIMTAARGGCDFIITLAAPAWAGDSIVMAQSRAIAVAATGKWDAEAHQRRLLDIAKGPFPETIAAPMLVLAMTEFYGDAAQLPQVKESIETAAKQMTSPSYREFMRYEPREDMRAITVPWLALNGTKDIQVPVDNLKTVAENNPQAHCVELEGHNHLFQECLAGTVQEYARLAEPPSEATLKVILDWLSHQSVFQGK